MAQEFETVTKRKQHYKVLINYRLPSGVMVSQSLYTGPHRKHADKAFTSAGALGNHGILRDCTVSFFDGFRIRADLTKNFLTRITMTGERAR